MKIVRAIAFYLPQYHPVPENDEWWGKGFTEWTNVTKAKPLFPGHYQPHMPADLGFYDLRLPEVREQQVSLAKEYGIHGFCYYHYWFNGRRILERPVNDILASGTPDFPFCLCWANENWTRVWDGGDKDVLLEQNYNYEDDLAHIQSLIPSFKDHRYIQVNGKPLLLVYRTGLLPDPIKTTLLWREEARKAGFLGIYLVRVESHGDYIDPNLIGFDASVEFPPFNGLSSPIMRGMLSKLAAKLRILPKVFGIHDVFEYRSVATAMLNQLDPAFKRFRCVTPGWDNTARRNKGGVVLVNSTPEIYEHWLLTIVKKTCEKFTGDERIVFINAWNEWAEGNHLEPDQKWGHAFLDATLRVICTSLEGRSASNSAVAENTVKQVSIRSIYWSVIGKFRHSRAKARQFFNYLQLG
jgi:lipopolysaccharide biosynthesis protein